jgi:predicted ester cyclase
MQFVPASPAIDIEGNNMADFNVRNQQNKAVVWEYWQRMNHAQAKEVPGIVKKAFHKDVNWNGPQPINEIGSSDALIRDFWEPLRHSFPDIKREAEILMGDVDGDDDWVSGMGYLTGTFVHDWLGIPATGKKTHIHFGQFFVMRDAKIVESYCILDILSVFKQAGFQVLPNAQGREGGKLQKPRGDDGILLAEQDALEGRQSKQLVEAMWNGLMRFERERDNENLDAMEQQHYWHPDFHWMGPTGIGSTHNILEFQDFHQRPWLSAFGDRNLDVEHTGRYMGFLGEGRYAAGGIWNQEFSTHHGQYQGVPATGKLMTIRDFDWYNREGNHIVQNWIPIDLIDVFKQLDVDLFDRMHRQHELRKRGIDWWNIPVDGMSALADSRRKF